MELLNITSAGWIAIVIALSMFVLAGMMFILGKGRMQITWGIFCLVTALWSGAFYAVTLAHDPVIADYWWRIAYIFIILVPFVFIHFALEFIDGANTNKHKNSSILALYLAALFFIAFNFKSNYILSGVRLLFGGELYYGTPGILHPYFTALYMLLIAGAYVVVFREYRLRREDRMFRQQVNYFFFATGFGLLGASMNFLPVYGVEVHPSTNMTVVVGASFVALAILRYQLFNIRVVTAQFLTLILTGFAIVRLVVSSSPLETTFNIILLVVTLTVGIYLILSVRKEVEQREKIEELSNQKSEFMSFASHELRNPLTTIKGLSSEILEGDFGEVSPQVKDATRQMFIRANDNVQLIEQYLAKSKFELGQVTYQFAPVDLKELVAQIVNDFKHHLEQKKLSISFVSGEGNFSVNADKGKLQEVISNLIDNAIKYSPENVKVDVMLERKDGMVTVRVKDYGMGIPKEVREHLFKKFGRAADARKVNIKGSGLGLYLSKEFTEAHKGRISVESEGEGKGSTFIVELPAM